MNLNKRNGMNTETRTEVTPRDIDAVLVRFLYDAHGFAERTAHTADFLLANHKDLLATIFYGWAYDIEMMMAGLSTSEPERSILHLSAASLAYSAKLPDEARLMAEQGLKGNPPEEIADDLREVLRKLDEEEKS